MSNKDLMKQEQKVTDSQPEFSQGGFSFAPEISRSFPDIKLLTMNVDVFSCALLKGDQLMVIDSVKADPGDLVVLKDRVAKFTKPQDFQGQKIQGVVMKVLRDYF